MSVHVYSFVQGVVEQDISLLYGNTELNESLTIEDLNPGGSSPLYKEDNLLTLHMNPYVHGLDAAVDGASVSSLLSETIISSSSQDGGDDDGMKSTDSEHSSKRHELDRDSEWEEMEEEGSQTWCGFKLVGDNIDKTVRPRHETIDMKSQSLHYFNAYAVLDRVNLSSFSDIPPTTNIHNLPLELLLPSASSLHALYSNFAVLVARVLTQNLKSFSSFADIVPSHIEHTYQEQMAKKSVVVS